MKGKLILENGNTFEGEIITDNGIKTGRVVFDTRVVGHEKVLTSPGYCGKIVCFTYPLIGNYGVNYEDTESDTVFPSGIVISEHSGIYSNFRAKSSIKEFLENKGVTVIEGIDTQCITEIVRENKGIKGVIASSSADDKEIQAKMREDIRVDIPVEPTVFVKDSPYIAVLNKAKRSEITFLQSSGLKLSFLNKFDSESKDVLSRAQGIYLASSFEDIPSIDSTAEIVGGIIGDVPVLGAGAGHLAVVLAMGGKISEEKVNHYGTNHPVRDTLNGKQYITEQSHSLIAETESLNKKERFININDGSVEGIADKKNKVLSVTFNPQRAIIEEFFSLL